MADSKLGHVRVFIDSCVWNFLFDRGIDLAQELPSGEFRLFIVCEGEFEIEPLESKKAGLARFVRQTIERAKIRTWRDFGFFDHRHSKEDQRAGGYGERGDSSVGGFWVEADEAQFKKQLLGRYPQCRKKTVTRLYPNEADIALAVRSLHSVVLTLDRKQGPLRLASERGGKVVYLNDFNPAVSSLAELVKGAWQGGGAMRTG